MIPALRSEWTKLRTVSSSAWLCLGVVTVTVALSAMVTASVDVRHGPADPTQTSLFGVRVGQIAVVVLAVLVVSNEYGNRMIQTTFTATPRRWTVLAAKVSAVTAVTLVAGTIGVALSLYIGRGILPGRGFTAANGYPLPSLADEATRRAVLGSIGYLVLIGLLSIGIATIVRDTAGAITTVLALLFLAPMITFFISDPQWHRRLDRYAPMTAGLSVQQTRDLASLPVGPVAGLATLGVWAAAALLAGAVVLRLRDTQRG